METQDLREELTILSKKNRGWDHIAIIPNSYLMSDFGLENNFGVNFAVSVRGGIQMPVARDLAMFCTGSTLNMFRRWAFLWWMNSY
ncbi:MAG: hypothetical protein ACOYOE_13095 [Chlorobium sp.]